METFAAIDIGSNSSILTVLEFHPGGNIKLLEEKIKMDRTLKGISDRGMMSDKMIKKISSTVNSYKKVALKHNTKKIFLFGTASLRKIKNIKKVKDLILKKTGLRLKIIPGKTEASLSFLAATAELKDSHSSVVLDIGGGSTEIALLNKGISIRLGALFLKDHFKVKYPVGKSSLDEIKCYILKKLSNVHIPKSKKFIYGVGGTFSTAVSIKLELKKYLPKAIDRKTITRKDIKALIEILSRKDLSSLKRVKGMPKGREDIIVPGLLIALCILESFSFDHIVVRNRGVRYGMLFRYFFKKYPASKLRIIY